MKAKTFLKTFATVALLSSCNNAGGNNTANSLSGLLNNPDVINGLINGKSTQEIATTALLNNIGIGNITGGSEGGAGNILTSLLGGGNSSNGKLANAALSNGMFENVLSQTLNSSGYLNNDNPQYLLNADISDISKAIAGTGDSTGAVKYNLINKATGASALNKSLSSNAGTSSVNAVGNNVTQLLGLLNSFQN